MTFRERSQNNNKHSYIVVIIQIPYLHDVVMNGIQEISQGPRPR